MKSLNHSGKIKLVPTDCAMPEMNGMDLLSKIRDKLENIPMIVMTAYEDKEIALDPMRRRCSGFIDKPFTTDELMNVVNHVMI